MKWPHGNSGATYLRYVIDTVQTVQYSDSQCTVKVYTQLPPKQPPASQLIEFVESVEFTEFIEFNHFNPFIKFIEFVDFIEFVEFIKFVKFVELVKFIEFAPETAPNKSITFDLSLVKRIFILRI